MYLSSRNESLDSLFLGLPLIGLLFFGYFRLDEVFARSKPKPGPEAPPRTARIGYIVEDDSAMMTDPDNRTWEKPLPRRY